MVSRRQRRIHISDEPNRIESRRLDIDRAIGPVQLEGLELVLIWVGFNDQQIPSLAADFGDFDAIGQLSSKDISKLAASYAGRTINDGRIHFGLVRTKRLQALVHWTLDFARIGERPSTDDLTREEFLKSLKLSAQRADIRAQEDETAALRSKEATPGKLKGEKDFINWETGLVNQLSILRGISGVPLVYVIREESDDDSNAQYDTFEEECIARCPLEGPQFEADAKQVHQLIVSSTTGELSEEWIKSNKRKRTGA